MSTPQNPYPTPEEKPLWKKKRFIIPAALVTLVAAVSVMGGDNEESSTTANTTYQEAPMNEAPVNEAPVNEAPVNEAPMNEAVEETASKTNGQIGETLNSKDLFVTASNLRVVSDVIGNYTCIDANFVNNRNTEVDISAFGDFELTDSNKVTLNSTVGGESTAESVKLGPGGTKNVTTCFKNDGTSGEVTITYSPMFSFSNDQLTWSGVI